MLQSKVPITFFMLMIYKLLAEMKKALTGLLKVIKLITASRSMRLFADLD